VGVEVALATVGERVESLDPLDLDIAVDPVDPPTVGVGVALEAPKDIEHSRTVGSSFEEPDTARFHTVGSPLGVAGA